MILPTVDRVSGVSAEAQERVERAVLDVFVHDGVTRQDARDIAERAGVSLSTVRKVLRSSLAVDSRRRPASAGSYYRPSLLAMRIEVLRLRNLKTEVDTR